MKPIERRSFARPIELREAEDGTIDVRGYAAVFDSVSYREVVKPGAFNRTLAQRDDVRLLINHDGIPLARTKSGTLGLTVDSVGLAFEAKGLDPANPMVQELRSALSRGDIDQCSFSFEALDALTVDGIRELREVKLYDVSIVTYPWYEETSVEMNSAARFVEARKAGRAPSLAARMRMDAALRAAPEGMSSFNDITEVVCDAICDRIEEMGGESPDYLWVADIGPTWAVYSSGAGDYFLVSYEMADDVVTSLGEPSPVTRVTTWVPDVDDVDPSAASATESNSKPLTAAEARALFNPAA